MLLTKLKILGFKSFVDTTLLKFSKGITAIVGPNGCGKSNIADSLKWALGAGSAKTLRGPKMEDLIFSGSQKRRALNLAEVTMTFSDASSFFSSGWDELVITRRAFRGGESEYLINGKSCRLRDIHDLFSGWGLSGEAFAFFEQGRVDQLIQMKPSEMRALVEEISGIGPFKKRRSEACLKLEKTDLNLSRVFDLLHELKKEIQGLEDKEGAPIFSEPSEGVKASGNLLYLS